MGAITSYADLVDFGQPVIETREAAARLATSTSNASHLLRAAERAGLVRRLRAGLWAIDPSVAPFAVAPYLTAPFPAYVSTWSALARHEMIEQIPASVFVVSLDRSRTVRTSVGQFSIHHITPELFEGFEGDTTSGNLASAEKALFDLVYTRAPRGGLVHMPELTLPVGFDRSRQEGWITKIERPRLRTTVARGLQSVLTNAEGEDV